MHQKTKRILASCVAFFMAMNLSGFAAPAYAEKPLNEVSEVSLVSEQPEEEDTTATVSELPEEEDTSVTVSELPEEEDTSATVSELPETTSATETTSTAAKSTLTQRTTSLPTKAVEQAVVTTTPQESDFTVSGGTITGLSSAYLNALSAEQKADIHLVIPRTINGAPVKSIGANAFKSGKYSGCTFTHLDLSAATSLTSIDNYAFYGNGKMTGQIVLPNGLTTIGNQVFENCASLTGSLVLPDSVTTIGAYAFRECKGLTGTLTLSKGLTAISNYAFYNAGFTGTLELPNTLKTIGDSVFRQGSAYQGFSGKLVIPEGITSIGTNAFSYQKALTSVSFPSTLEKISNSLFLGGGLTGVLTIPENIQTIGTKAFSNTNIEMVYLPDTEYSHTSTYLASSSFGDYNSNSISPNLKAIVCSQTNYETLKSILHEKVKGKLAYPVEVQFETGGHEPLQCLYNQPLNLQKQADDSWATDATFALPEQSGASEGTVLRWGFDKTKLAYATNTTNVTGTTLYSIVTPNDPKITLGADIDAVYDGEAHPLIVHAEHPRYHTYSGAKLGDVVFYYWWKWDTIGSSDYVLQGFDENQYDVVDVRAPDHTISCSVIVQAYYINSVNGKPTAQKYYEEPFSFGVHLQRAEPTVTPVYPEGLLNVNDGLPKISLSEGDSAGTITWDAEQTPTVGEQSYTWTFQSAENAVGNYNHNTKTGTATLNFVDGEVYQLQVTTKGDGTVAPSGSSEIVQGQDVLLTFTPGNKNILQEVLVDGKNVVASVVDNQYTIQNVQQDCTVSVLFKQVEDVVQDVVDKLPEISEGVPPTDEQVQSILDAKFSYELLGDEQSKLTEAEQDKLCDALLQVPQIEISKNETAPLIQNEAKLMDQLTAEDVQTLAQNPSAHLVIEMQMAPATPDEDEQKLLEGAIHAEDVLGPCYDITFVKKLTLGTEVTQTPLTELKRPVTLTLSIPEDLESEDSQMRRDFFMVRLHDNTSGVQSAVLKDQDDVAKTITISSDQFSIYAMAYSDTVLPKEYVITATAGANGSISPSGTLTVTEGMDQLFTITPDNGYEVDQLLVDDVAVTETTSYTFTDVSEAHTISVTFREKEEVSEPESSEPESSESEPGDSSDESGDASNDSSAESKSGSSTKTGDQQALPWMLGIFLLGLSGTVGVLLFKKQKNR